jgi:hypothetical protein
MESMQEELDKLKKNTGTVSADDVRQVIESHYNASHIPNGMGALVISQYMSY